MIKKTIYDDLLSYKISSDDIKIITETIIYAQENDIKLKLDDIIALHSKKVGIKKIKLIIQKAVENNVKPDISDFFKFEHRKEEFINHFGGWVYAKIKKINTSIEELNVFAKSKTDIINLIDNFVELKGIEKELVLKDFTKCKFCLYKQGRFFQILKKLKHIDKKISLKNLLKIKLQPYDLDEIYLLYKNASNLKIKLTIEQLALLKTKRYDIKNIVEALIISEEHKLRISSDTIYDIASKGHDVKEVVAHSFNPKAYILKPVSVVLKSNIEILLKISILIKSDIDNFTSGISYEFMNLKIIELFKSEFGKYENLNEVYHNLALISENVTKNTAKLNTAYKVISITVEDIDYGRNLNDEFELKNLQMQRKIVEEKAKISEAVNKVKTFNQKEDIKNEHH